MKERLVFVFSSVFFTWANWSGTDKVEMYVTLKVIPSSFILPCVVEFCTVVLPLQCGWVNPVVEAEGTAVGPLPSSFRLSVVCSDPHLIRPDPI